MTRYIMDREGTLAIMQDIRDEAYEPSEEDFKQADIHFTARQFKKYIELYPYDLLSALDYDELEMLENVIQAHIDSLA